MLVSHLHERVDEMPPLPTGIMIETQQRILSLYRTSMKDLMELVRNQAFSEFPNKEIEKKHQGRLCIGIESKYDREETNLGEKNEPQQLLTEEYGELTLVQWDGVESCLCGLANVYVDYLEQRVDLLVNAMRGSILKIVDHMHLEQKLENGS